LIHTGVCKCAAEEFISLTWPEMMKNFTRINVLAGLILQY
jgi:hypothetical protein